MLRVLELLGLLGPVVGLVLLVLWRKRVSAQPMIVAVVGAVIAVGASGLAVLGERAIWLGGSEGVMERFETVSLWRWIVLMVAVVALSVAVLIGRAAGERPIGWLAMGWLLFLLGFGANLGTGAAVRGLDQGSEHGLASLAQIVGDTVQFAAVGLAIVVLCVGVAARRTGGGSDAGAEAMELAGRAWRAYRGMQR